MADEITIIKIPELTVKTKTEVGQTADIIVELPTGTFRTKSSTFLLNVINDLVTGGITDTLSAEQGVVLKALFDWDNEVDGLIFDYAANWTLVNTLLVIDVTIPACTIRETDNTIPVAISGTTGTVIENGGIVLTKVSAAVYSYSFVDDLTTVVDGTDDVYIIAKNLNGSLYTRNTSLSSFITPLPIITTDDVTVINDGSVTHLGELSEHLAHSSSPYVSIGGAVTDNGDGTINITEAEVWIKQTNDLDGEFIAVVVPEDDLTITAQQNIIIYIDYDGGTPVFKQMQSVAGYFYSNWDTIPIATVVNDGTKIIVNDFRETATNGTYKNILGQINYEPFRYLGGLGASDAGTRNPATAAGAVLFSNEYLPIAAFDTSGAGTFTRMFVTAGTWTRTTGQTTINNTDYNDVATGMVALANTTKHANKFLYHIKDTPSYWILLEGQTEYDNLVAAQEGGTPASLPPELSPFYAGALLVAKYIIKKSTATFVDIQNPFETPFSSSTASLHNNLGGLELAATGVTYGHVDDQAQSLYGLKTAVTNVIDNDSETEAFNLISSNVDRKASLTVIRGASSAYIGLGVKVTDNTVVTESFKFQPDGTLEITQTPPTDSTNNDILTWNSTSKAIEKRSIIEVIQLSCSDLTTALTTGTSKAYFRVPYAMTLTEVRASVLTAPTGAALVVDINESGTTILSTKLSIDVSEKTSETAATPPVISDASLADDAEITIDIDTVGSTIAGAGLIVTLKGYKT